MTTAIHIDSLAERFGDVEALAGLNLDVGVGEVFGYLGPNGAGSVPVPIASPTSAAASAGASLGRTRCEQSLPRAERLMTYSVRLPSTTDTTHSRRAVPPLA
jgi:ABC-2 type transport system ATP-binding protein